MTEVGFYHCTRVAAAEVAVRLAAKAHESGQRLLVVGEGDALAALDTALWTADPASFLPHAVAGGPHDADQPILLAPDADPANGARLLMLLDRPVPERLEPFERVLLLFDEGGDGQARAREQWKSLARRPGTTRSYWQQKPGGGWEKKG
jgi:DNA polymerase-3 subunit chi